MTYIVNVVGINLNFNQLIPVPKQTKDVEKYIRKELKDKYNITNEYHVTYSLFSSGKLKENTQ